MGEKVDVLDLVINVLKEHETKLDEHEEKLDQAIGRLEVMATSMKEMIKSEGKIAKIFLEYLEKKEKKEE